MNKKVFCIQCNKYFENIQDFNKEHDKISYQVMKVKHNFLKKKIVWHIFQKFFLIIVKL